MPGSVFMIDPDTGAKLGTTTAPWITTATPPAGSLPIGATALQGSSGNVAAGVAAVTLAAVAAKTNYLAGFDITGAGATAASVILATITGLLGGTRTYALAIPAGAAVGISPLVVRFDPPLPASAVNTAIVVSAPSFGAGNTNAVTNAQGYLL